MRMVISATVLRKAVEAIGVVVDEAKFRITKDGISSRMVDPANVAMVSLELSSKEFEVYEATIGEIGVDLSRLNGILGMASKDDKVELCLNEGTRKLEIHIGGLSCTMSLLEPASIKEPKTPSLDLPARIVLDGAILWRAVKAAEKICDDVRSDHMVLGVAGKTFYMEAEGGLDKVRIDVPEAELFMFKSSGDVRSLFSLDYLNDLVKSLGKAERVTIDLGTDLPARLEFDVSSGCNIVYMLAPRVER